MRILWMILLPILVLLGCFVVMPHGDGNESIPPPPTFDETDLVGTWQATYGTKRIDRITLKSDGTYQQVFQAPNANYFYESPWNKWYVEYSSNGIPKLHLEGMRYYVYDFQLGEMGGRDKPGEPILFFDGNRAFRMVDKVILNINGDKKAPKNIILWHMQIDPDEGPAFFVFVEEG